MKKVIILIATVLAALSCTKEQTYLDPCTFEIAVTKVKASKVWFTIKPSNPKAYYAFGIFSEKADIYDLPVMELAKMNLGWWKDAYDVWKAGETNAGSFADVFCYQEEREIKQTGLGSGLEHRCFVVQLNPETFSIIGTPQEVRFITRSVVNIPLTFDVQFSPDRINITPSDPSATYYWDYDSREEIESKYITPEIFFYSVVDLYEDYAFMPNMISQGTEPYVFSQQDKSMVEGEEYILILAGYSNGEINSAYTEYQFVYHKDKPIEYSLIEQPE